MTGNSGRRRRDGGGAGRRTDETHPPWGPRNIKQIRLSPYCIRAWRQTKPIETASGPRSWHGQVTLRTQGPSAPKQGPNKNISSFQERISVCADVVGLRYQGWSVLQRCLMRISVLNVSTVTPADTSASSYHGQQTKYSKRPASKQERTPPSKSTVGDAIMDGSHKRRRSEADERKHENRRHQFRPRTETNQPDRDKIPAHTGSSSLVPLERNSRSTPRTTNAAPITTATLALLNVIVVALAPWQQHPYEDKTEKNKTLVPTTTANPQLSRRLYANPTANPPTIHASVLLPEPLALCVGSPPQRAIRTFPYHTTSPPA